MACIVDWIFPILSMLLRYSKNKETEAGPCVQTTSSSKISSINNKSGLKSGYNILELRDSKFPPTSFVIEALELWLSCNNSIFNNTNYLQTDGTAQGPHMSCSYTD